MENIEETIRKIDNLKNSIIEIKANGVYKYSVSVYTKWVDFQDIKELNKIENSTSISVTTSNKKNKIRLLFNIR